MENVFICQVSIASNGLFFGNVSFCRCIKYVEPFTMIFGHILSHHTAYKNLLLDIQ